MSRVITITSGKGGVGKTTTTANLGTALAMQGTRVAVVDADIGLRNLDVVLGLENRIVYDLVDVIEGRCRLRQALIKDKHFPDLCLLPAAQTRDKDAVTADDMIALCNQLRAEFDYVLIDCPAGIEGGFRNAIAGADEVLIVTTPEVSAVRDADRIIGLVEAFEKGHPRLILNRLKLRMVNRGEMMSVEDVLQILAIDLVGVVPDDEAIVSSTNRGEVAVLDRVSQAGRAFADIARRIKGEQVPFMPLDDNQGMLERLFGMFGRRPRGSER
jgi:septum site-determining protein MinD